jgi:glycosyltransferase involved in cell wall biosynthesis
MSPSRPRLAILTSHPIQYQAPLYRTLSAAGRIDIEVLFLSDFGVEPSFDPGFGQTVRFDVPLTEGFAHRFVARGRAQRSIAPPFGHVNPSLVRHLRADRYDGVLVHGYAQVADWIAFASVAASGLRLLLRGETHEPTVEAQQALRWQVKRQVLAPVIRRADACLAIGLRNARFYYSLGARRDQVIFAPYSVDNDHFARGGAEGHSQRDRLLDGIGLDPDRPVVLFTAKLIARKRVLDLIAAMDEVAPAAQLLVIGDGEQRDTVAGLAAERPWMRSLGFVNQSDLPRWYGASDIFVLPSGRETWGLVVNEAMAAGAVPVVSDAVGCGPDLVAGGAGRVFPTGDVPALAGAIAELLDPEVRAEARSRCRERVERYDLAATANGIEEAMRRPGRRFVPMERVST